MKRLFIITGVILTSFVSTVFIFSSETDYIQTYKEENEATPNTVEEVNEVKEVKEEEISVISEDYMIEEYERIKANRIAAEEKLQKVKDEAEYQKRVAKEKAELHVAKANPRDIEMARPVTRGASVPRNSSKKTYMDFRKITSPSSTQYKIQQSGNTWIDDYGFQRYGEEGMYMVALGTGYSPGAGYVFDITLSSGKTFRALTGDIKSNTHTDESNKQHLKDGSVVEFIVNVENEEGESFPTISKKVKKAGDMSKELNSGMHGDVVSIEQIGKINK